MQALNKNKLLKFYQKHHLMDPSLQIHSMNKALQ